MPSTSFQRSEPEMLQITLDYPIKPAPRWAHEKPPHARLYRILVRGREHYRQHFRDIVALQSRMRAIPVVPSIDDPLAPAWSNSWFSGLNLAALYMFIARHRLSRYADIVSGWSTKIACRAARDVAALLHITSIDPQSRAEIDRLFDTLVPKAAEAVSSASASELEAEDVLFLDSSHRAFTNSDCVIFFLEIPRVL